MLWTGGLAWVLLAGEPVMPAEAADVARLERSQAAAGDVARLQHVLAKARRGEAISLVVIGGSITEGASASRPELRWGDLLAAHLREKLPRCEVRYHNAGIGATGSDLGAHRCARDVLVHEPDLVVAEYSVNDPDNDFAAETLEGLIRQVLSQPRQPAMMLLHTMHTGGGNAQAHHAVAGDHYGLPRVSFRDALWPDIEAGRLKWEEVEADEVHPNDRGHRYAAEFLAHAIDRVLDTLPTDAELPTVPPLPAPLYSDTFERTALLTAENAEVVESTGFEPGPAWRLGTGWHSEAPGSRLVFEADGTTFLLVFHRIKGPMGRAVVTIDGGPEHVCEAWFSATWGGYSACELIARDLPPGRHRISVRLAAEHHEESGGTRFEVHALLAAGLAR